jgi:hypothetical protein
MSTRVNGSPRTKTAINSEIDGDRYCRNPSVDNRTRRARGGKQDQRQGGERPAEDK